MEYVSLKKSFDSDGTAERFERARTLHMARLESESTFRTGVTIGEDELFLAVPRELSLLTQRVLRRERSIATRMRTLPPAAQRALLRGLVVDEVVNTNELEGINCTRRQVYELLREGRSDAGSLGQKRFRELARLYLDLCESTPERPVKVEDVRRIHNRVMSGEPLDEGRRGVGPEERNIKMVESMLSIANSDQIPQMYGAIMSHFIFERTHPFYDGGGRTGRYLLALHLNGPLSTPTVLSLSRVIVKNGDSYSRSLRETKHPLNHGELTPFVINVLECVSMAQSGLDAELARRREQYQAVTERLREFRDVHWLSDQEADVVYFLALLRLFAAFPDSMLAELADYMELSTQQVRVHTKRLEEKGVIATTSRKPLRFVLSEQTLLELDWPAPHTSTPHNFC